MFEKEAEDNKPPYAYCALDTKCELWKDGFQKGAEFVYNKANKWHTPEEEPKPIGRYAEQSYPQIPCLVEIIHFGYGVRYWNVKEKCWDDEACDDYCCDMDKVKRWAYIEEEA